MTKCLKGLSAREIEDQVILEAFWETKHWNPYQLLPWPIIIFLAPSPVIGSDFSLHFSQIWFSVTNCFEQPIKDRKKLSKCTRAMRGIVVPYAPDIRSTALLRQKSKHKVIKSENNRALVPSIHSGDSRSRSATNAHISARKHTDCAADAWILSCAKGPRFPHSSTVKTARRTNNQQPLRMNMKGHSTELVRSFPTSMWELFRPTFPAQAYVKISQKEYIKAQKALPEAGEDGSILCRRQYRT